MRRALALAALVALAAPAAAQKPAAPAGKPDLVVTSFGFTGPTATSVPKPTCEPNTVVYSFSVVVTNAGAAPSPSSASLGGKPLLSVMAQDRAGWGANIALPEIAPGKTATVSADVLFLLADPTYMVKANHPFLATLDPQNAVDEADETNNTKGPLVMGPPAGCERLVKKR